MKYIKKILIIVMLLIGIIPLVNIGIRAEEVPIPKANGNGYVTYIGSDRQVTIPTEYIQPDASVRAVWVSALAGDIGRFSSEEQYKEEIISVLETMEYFNLNVMIFHVRVRNDAFYESKYNNWSEYYNTNPSWDALPWIIEECHRRGIEFHAWLNPYRVAGSGVSDLEALSKNFKAINPASNPDNLLKGSDCVILNPGLPVVRDFLIKTCMEVVENYDVDAIHFDDYFYADGIDDAKTRAMYNTTGMSTDDWRREQVNLFIEGLSKEIRVYNQKTGKGVQLGISPSGIWRSGDGKVTYDENGNAITNGSNTRSDFIHYGGYLYADTVKWINEEWIDYILPQTYWAIEHSTAGFPDLVDWWSEVVRYKKVNLYVAMGLYMKNESGGSSWVTNDLEGYNEVMFARKHDTIRGMSIYKYSFVREAITNDRSFKKVKDLWSIPTVLPEIRTREQIISPEVENLKVGKVENGYRLQFDEVDNGKFYCIYRSKNPITFDPTELIDVIGNNSYDGVINYVDKVNNKDDYYYGIKVQSNSLTLNQGKTIDTKNAPNVEKAPLDKVQSILINGNLTPSSTIDVRWDVIRSSFGSDINYELQYSLDNAQWITNTNSIELYKSRGYVTTTLNIPSVATSIYIRIKAYNDIGESISDVLEVSLYKQVDKITNFSYIGNSYANKQIEFVWNNMIRYPNAIYTLQVSRDNFAFEDLETIPSTNQINNRFKYQLPNNSGKYYYRIKGEDQGMIAYSETLTLDISVPLENILPNFTFNGEKPDLYFVGREGEYLVIEYDYHQSSLSPITYTSYLSRNNKNWLTAKVFNPGNRIEINGNRCKQYIYLPEYEFKMYYYLEISTSNKVYTSVVYEIYIVPQDIFLEDFMEFLNNEKNSLLNKFNMTK